MEIKIIKKQNQELKNELQNLQQHARNLEEILNKITSSKAFKLWQKFCDLRKKNKNVFIYIFIFLKNLIPIDFRYKIKNLILLILGIEDDFKKYKKTLESIKNKEIIQSKKKESVSVIIPVKNGGSLFRMCLEKIRSQKNVKINEIIVIDSESNDNTVKIAKEYKCKVISIPQKSFSHSKSRNLGAKYASGKYLMFTVRDATLVNDFTISDLINQIKINDAAAGSVKQIPRIDADIFSSWQISLYNKILSPTGNNLIINIPKEKFKKLSPMEKRQFCVIDDVYSIFNQKKFKSLGGFNEKITYAEDLEIAKRLIEAGEKLVFLTENGVIHSHNRNADYFLKRYIMDTFLIKIFDEKKITKKIKNNKNDLIDPEVFLISLFFAVKKYEKYIINYLNNKENKVNFYSKLALEEIIKNLKMTHFLKPNQVKNSVKSWTDIFYKEIFDFVDFHLNSIKKIFKNISKDDYFILIDKITSIILGNKIGDFLLKNKNDFIIKKIYKYANNL
ncbi:MAG: glycosyltransferase [Microgenomates group bacterium]|nr:glycosyltransferase [Microgenomates group bacterium]